MVTHNGAMAHLRHYWPIYVAVIVFYLLSTLALNLLKSRFTPSDEAYVRVQLVPAFDAAMQQRLDKAAAMPE